MTTDSFNPAAVLLEGQQLIDASAGTGKTHNITFLVIRLVIEKKLSIDRVLVVTFTEAATEELKSKIRQRLTTCLCALQGNPSGDRMLDEYVKTVAERPAATERIAAAIRDFDQAAIYTIHGFCNRLLKLHAFETGTSFDAVLSTDDSEFIAELGADFWANLAYQADPDWVRILQSMGYSPEHFAGLASGFSRRSDIALLFEKKSGGFARLKIAKAETAAVLKKSVAEISALFASHPGVKKTSYSKRFVPAWLADAGRYLNGTAVTLPPGFDYTKEWIEQKHPMARFSATVLAAKAPAGTSPPEHLFFQGCERIMLAAEDVIYDACAIRAEFREWLQNVVPERKRRLGILFFDDLISQLDLAISDAVSGPLLQQAVKTTYGAALIDEFQDTDTAQYSIFSRLFQGTGMPFFMIGDPKQSIYGFRGGDVFAYLKAVRSADARHTLGTNWRSDPGLINGVNQLFMQTTNPFLHAEISFKPVAPRPGSTDTLHIPETSVSPLQFLLVETESVAENKNDSDEGESEGFSVRVASDVATLLQSGATLGSPPRPIKPSDIAILVYTHRQGKEISDALRECGISSVNTAQASVYQSDATVDFYRVLLAVASPRNAKAVRAALTTWLFGRNAEEIAHLSSNDELWDGEIAFFENLKATWIHRGFVHMTQSLLQRKKELLSNVLRTIGGERYLTDLYHLIELLRMECFQRKTGILTLIRHLESAMLDQVAGAQDATIRLETEADAVQLVTIHKSKGLQYPVVILPYLWTRRMGPGKRPGLVFHDPRDHFQVKMDLGSRRSSEALEQAEQEDQQEQMRLLYVALTRAQHHCRVVWGAMPTAGKTALSRLLHPSVHSEENGGGPLTDELVTHDLQRLVQAGGDNVGVSPLINARVAYAAGECTERATLTCAQFIGRIGFPEVMTSFSRLTAGGRGDSPGLDEQHGARRGIESQGITGTPGGLVGFPRGTSAGTCLHKVFELIDFEPGAVAERSSQIARILDDHQYPSGVHGAAVSAMVERVLASPLSTQHSEVRLERVRRVDRLNELEFLVPIGAERTFHSEALSRAMAIDSTPGFAAYAASLAQLRFHDIAGFMRGVIDLIFVLDGRWYIVDYKSNDLGSVVESYTEEAISASMAAHHYYLQYHLYTVALDRLLRRRVPGYSYDRDFGGVFYLYLRGMGYGGANGVYFERPPHSRITAVSQLLGELTGLRDGEVAP